jgi:hypothetical protein
MEATADYENTKKQFPKPRRHPQRSLTSGELGAGQHMSCTDFQEARGRYWAKATQGTSSTFTCGWTCQSLASFYSTRDLLWKFRQRGPSPTSINPFPRLPVWISTSMSTFHTHTTFVQIKLSYSLMVLRLWSQSSTGLSISRSRFKKRLNKLLKSSNSNNWTTGGPLEISMMRKFIWGIWMDALVRMPSLT